MKLNQRQHKIIQFGAALILVTLLFPPFHFSPPGGGSIGLGYGFLLIPPESRAVVNVMQLFATWVGLLIALGMWVWLSDGWRPASATPDLARISPLQALRIALSRTGYLGLALLGMILFSVFRASDGHQAALKLFGNGGAALLVYAIALLWTAINAYRGKYVDSPTRKTNWRVITLAGAVIVTTLAAIGWVVEKRNGQQEARGLFIEDQISGK